MNDESIKIREWSDNVIIADADYIDKVAFDLTVNFERMIGRAIPKADIAHWLDCVALDGGVREGENDIQVIFIHDKKQASLAYFNPGNYEKELNDKAFKDKIGEFSIGSYAVEDVVSKDEFFIEAVKLVSNAKDVKRIMVIPDSEKIYNKVRAALNEIDDESKRITVFSMQPMTGGNFRQEILGYSLMSALGIRGDEIK